MTASKGEVKCYVQLGGRAAALINFRKLKFGEVILAEEKLCGEMLTKFDSSG